MPITDKGYTADTVKEIVDVMSQDTVVKYGLDTDTTDNSILGILLGIDAIQINQQSNYLQELSSNQDPDSAEGKALDDICFQVGLIRKAATPSTALLTFTNNTDVLQTIPAGIEVKSTSGDIFTLDSTINLDSPTGSTGTSEATAVEAGAIEAAANTLTGTSLGTALITATNLDDAQVGTEVESDTDLRTRRKRFLQAGGNGTNGAVASALSNINGVTDILVIDNDTGEPVDRGEGRVPRPTASIEVVVEGGSSEEIGQAIALSKSQGIKAFGDVTINVENPPSIIGFTRVQTLDVVVDIKYNVYDEEILPNSVEDLLKENTISFAETEYILGKDVLTQRIAYGSSSGVSGIGSVNVSVSLDGDNFSNEGIRIAPFQRASIDIVNITVSRNSEFEL